MFERFTDRARRVVILAQEEARALGERHIGTEHILIALCAENEAMAAQVLHSLGFTTDNLKETVLSLSPHPQETLQPASAHLYFTPRAKKVLELSLREALQLGHNYIGTEHILLGLLRGAEDSLVTKIFLEKDITLNQVRSKVWEALYGTDSPPRPSPPVVTGRSSLVLTSSERAAWNVAVQRGVRISQDDVRAMLLAARRSGEG